MLEWRAEILSVAVANWDLFEIADMPVAMDYVRAVADYALEGAVVYDVQVSAGLVL